MSEYQVIARKWRPQRFSDMVGQEHILRTLKNAIINQRTAHAYLFVGPRGIGKTTTARIFAKALNCLNPQDGEPCCECESCRAITQNNSLDVIEIDAASHNSAEYMRDLTEEVMHLPVSGRYKIYIIDEVHMLTKQAWNAMLKTVEEPPAHVKFIFATTEAHQVLPTIVSRCQRFDLQPFATNEIVGRLSEIATAEKVNISNEALEAIARAASGGMRDAQSLLDQMISFFADGENDICEEDVLTMFGLTASKELEAIVSAMFLNSPADVVTAIFTLAKRGRNLETLFGDILDTLRGVEITLLLGSRANEVLESDPDTLKRYADLAIKTTPSAIRSFLESLSGVGRVMHDSLNKQVFLETILLKSMRQAHAVRLDDVLARLNQLRKAGDLQFLEQIPSVTRVEPTPVVVVEQPKIEEKIVEPPKAEPKVEVAPTPTPKPPPAPTPVVVENSGDGKQIWQKLSTAVKGEYSATWNDRFAQAQVISYANNILKMAIPTETEISSSELQTVESQLLSVLQNLTGEWGTMLLLEQTSIQQLPAEVSEPETVEVTETIEEPETVEEPEAVEVVETVEEPEAIEEVEEEENLDYIDNSVLSTGDSEHSLLGDIDAFNEAQSEPAVHIIRDMFGGIVVDIHKM